MPISSYLGDANVDPETKRVMGVAFEIICAALKVAAPNDELKPIIALKIIELAEAGQRDPNELSERVLIDLRNRT